MNQSTGRFPELERLIQDAVDAGAELVVGGKAWKHPYVDEGMYFEGTVVANVSPSMEIAQQERASCFKLSDFFIR